MDVREKRWQCPVASEGKDHSRGTQNVAGDKSEGGDGRAREQNRASNIAEKFRGCFGERRVLVIREIGAKRSLRHELDRDVNNGGDNEREVSGTRHRARRIFYFTARNQCHFDSDEREDQENDAVA